MDIESDEIEPQRGWMLRAELNRLLREIGTEPTLDALIAIPERDAPFGPAWLLIDASGCWPEAMSTRRTRCTCGPPSTTDTSYPSACEPWSRCC